LFDALYSDYMGMKVSAYEIIREVALEIPYLEPTDTKELDYFELNDPLPVGFNFPDEEEHEYGGVYE